MAGIAACVTIVSVFLEKMYKIFDEKICSLANNAYFRGLLEKR